MGTRNLTCVVQGGAFKVAQYGQWDGYPSGQGRSALGFLRGLIERGQLDTFAAKVAACRFFTEAETDELDKGDPFEKYPYLSRNTGAGILNVILTSENGLKLVDQHQFAADGLFCEWAYVIDLDRRTFEVYVGFKNEPAPDGERFAFLNTPKDQFVPGHKGQNYYGPVHLAKSYSLDALPTYEEFIADFTEPDEEEEQEAATAG